MSETEPTALPPYGMRPPAFRLPDGAHVGTVHLQVVDLQRSLTYYEQVLGLRAHGVTDRSAVLSAHDDGRPLLTLHTKRDSSATMAKSPTTRSPSFSATTWRNFMDSSPGSIPPCLELPDHTRVRGRTPRHAPSVGSHVPIALNGHPGSTFPRSRPPKVVGRCVPRRD
jgi:hypothetical protein